GSLALDGTGWVDDGKRVPALGRLNRVDMAVRPASIGAAIEHQRRVGVADDRLDQLAREDVEGLANRGVGAWGAQVQLDVGGGARSEERRVGKECRARGGRESETTGHERHANIASQG